MSEVCTVMSGFGCCNNFYCLSKSKKGRVAAEDSGSVSESTSSTSSASNPSSSFPSSSSSSQGNRSKGSDPEIYFINLSMVDMDKISLTSDVGSLSSYDSQQLTIQSRDRDGQKDYIVPIGKSYHASSNVSVYDNGKQHLFVSPSSSVDLDDDKSKDREIDGSMLQGNVDKGAGKEGTRNSDRMYK